MVCNSLSLILAAVSLHTQVLQSYRLDGPLHTQANTLLLALHTQALHTGAAASPPLCTHGGHRLTACPACSCSHSHIAAARDNAWQAHSRRSVSTCLHLPSLPLWHPLSTNAYIRPALSPTLPPPLAPASPPTGLSHRRQAELCAQVPHPHRPHRL